MAHGQASRPLESEDGSKVTVESDGHRRAIATSDRTLLEVAEETLLVQKKILLLLQILTGEEIDDNAV